VRFKRITVIVLDSVGIGELPDAGDYGDVGSDTVGNIVRLRGERGLNVPGLLRLGLGNIEGVDELPAEAAPTGAYGRMAERSKGKDTTTGHWEMAGITSRVPFPVFKEGFPKEMTDRFSEVTGLGFLGGYPASGTEIIEKLGDEHVRTGKPIIYTSADSVFQIAAHEDVIPVDRLYEVCRKTRAFLRDEWGVARVIARPFTTEGGKYVRTGARRDFSIEPTGTTMLDVLSSAGFDVLSVGKIDDIFAGRGITRPVHHAGNPACIDDTVKLLKEDFTGVLFVNLVDFDMKYGHRNDVEGYAEALEYFDGRLNEILELTGEGDLLIITADHGCDPSTPSTDHSREYVPLIIAGSGVKPGPLGTIDGFSCIAATVCDNFGLEERFSNSSLLGRI